MNLIDLNEIISEVVVTDSTGVPDVAVSRSKLCSTANLPLVRGDNVHLQQILLNLLLNGMEAMADVPGNENASQSARH